MFRMPFSDTKRATITAADTPGGRCHRPARNETEGKMLESTLEYSKQTTRPGRETENSFIDRSDMLGRHSTESRTETTSERGDTSRR